MGISSNAAGPNQSPVNQPLSESVPTNAPSSASSLMHRLMEDRSCEALATVIFKEIDEQNQSKEMRQAILTAIQKVGPKRLRIAVQQDSLLIRLITEASFPILQQVSPYLSAADLSQCCRLHTSLNKLLNQNTTIWNEKLKPMAGFDKSTVSTTKHPKKIYADILHQRQEALVELENSADDSRDQGAFDGGDYNRLIITDINNNNTQARDINSKLTKKYVEDFLDMFYSDIPLYKLMNIEENLTSLVHQMLDEKENRFLDKEDKKFILNFTLKALDKVKKGEREVVQDELDSIDDPDVKNLAVMAFWRVMIEHDASIVHDDIIAQIDGWKYNWRFDNGNNIDEDEDREIMAFLELQSGRAQISKNPVAAAQTFRQLKDKLDFDEVCQASLLDLKTLLALVYFDEDVFKEDE